MKALYVTCLFVVHVIGTPGPEPIVGLARLVTSLRSKCVVATDLVCPRDDVTFWLYTRTTQDSPTQLNVSSLDSAPWVDAPLKFIVHGYSVDKDTAINEVLRPAYFSTGDFNIISVDWSPLCRQGCYLQAVENVPTVAKCVADFFTAVTRARQFPQVHLLGHSMGGHVAAWASERIQDLPRLTKFDVANPRFNSRNSRNGTAGFIDVYHSNVGLKGQREPSGDVDVFFNNNVFQPGCKCDTSCSHLRAVEFYAESITTPLRAFPCGGWQSYQNGECQVPEESDLVDVGEDADTRVKGTFMAFTRDQAPFILGDEAYTNSTNFSNYNKTVANECTIAYNYRRFIKDWF